MSHNPKHISLTLPSAQYNVLNNGITTRVMAQKLFLQLQKDNEERGSRRSSISKRRTSRFLSGTSIPNSTIRASLDCSKTPEINDFNLQNDTNEKPIFPDDKNRKRTYSFAKQGERMRRSDFEFPNNAAKILSNNGNEVENENIEIDNSPTLTSIVEQDKTTELKPIQKQDLQTQTSFILENLFIPV